MGRTLTSILLGLGIFGTALSTQGCIDDIKRREAQPVLTVINPHASDAGSSSDVHIDIADIPSYSDSADSGYDVPEVGPEVGHDLGTDDGFMLPEVDYEVSPDTETGDGAEVGPDVEYGCTTSEGIFVSVGDFSETVCGPNGFGTQVVKCEEDGINYVLTNVGDCDGASECEVGESYQQACSTDVGECEEGLETVLCQLTGESSAKYVVQNDCNGVLPGSEDTGKFPDGKDNDCDGPIDEDYFVVLPAGDFWQGCPDTAVCNLEETPIRLVAMSEFAIASYELTNAQLNACVEDGVCDQPDDISSATVTDYLLNPLFTNYAAVNMDFETARLACVRLSGNAEQIAEVQANPFTPDRMDVDIITAAEFEYASKGACEEEACLPGSLQMYATGSEPTASTANIAFVQSDVVEVGSYPANPAWAVEGPIYDLTGNAMERTGDWYTDDLSSLALSDPLGPPVGVLKVIMNGAWPHDIEFGESWTRNKTAPSDTSPLTGTRCTANPEKLYSED